MKRQKIARLLSRTGINYFARRFYRWSGVLCLNYHRIGNPNGSLFDHELWSADEEAFDAQVRFLRSNFDVCVPEDLPGILDRKRGRYVLITFDDGYLDNYTSAFPILRRHNARATFFVTTGFLDSPRLSWWDEIAWMIRKSPLDRIDVRPWLDSILVFDEPDRENAIRTLLRAYKAMPAASVGEFLTAIAAASNSGRFNEADAKGLWMTWEMVREMRAAGMSIGGHTVNHPVLARMPLNEQAEEIIGCGRRLNAELGERMFSFSYPVGQSDSFNSDTRKCLADAGVRFAFSYYGGYQRFDRWDDYNIHRMAIERFITLDWFHSIATFPQAFC